jgi:hypothetical protein
MYDVIHVTTTLQIIKCELCHFNWFLGGRSNLNFFLTDYSNYAYFDKRSYLNFLHSNHTNKLNRIWLGWGLAGPFLKLCVTAPPFIQDGDRL